MKNKFNQMKLRTLWIGMTVFLLTGCSKVSNIIHPAVVTDVPGGGGDNSDRTPIVVAIVTVSDITENSASIHYTIDPDASDLKGSNPESLSGGIVWSKESAPTLEDNQIEGGTELADVLDFSGTIENLKPNTTYYTRVYISNGISTGYSDEQSFTTLDGGPQAADLSSVISVENVSNHSSDVHFSIDEEASHHVSGLAETGIVFGTREDPTLDDAKIIATDLWDFSMTLENLEEQTTYFVRVYATNEAGTSYGDQTSFTTSIAFEDNFDRPDVPPFDVSVSPNPIDKNWDIFMGGTFQLKDNEVSIFDAAQSIMVFTPGAAKMLNEDGHSYRVGIDIKVSPDGTFGGVVLNAQPDGSFYLIRSQQDISGSDGTLVQVLKFGPGGTDNLLNVIFSGAVSGSYIDHYRIEVFSSEPGKLHVEFMDPGSHEVMLAQDFVDGDQPYANGFFGIFGFPLATPYNIAFDNFRLEVW